MAEGGATLPNDGLLSRLCMYPAWTIFSDPLTLMMHSATCDMLVDLGSMDLTPCRTELTLGPWLRELHVW